MRYKAKEHRLILEGGKRYPDYLQFCGAGEPLVLLSQRAVDVFKQNAITGFSYKEAVLVCDEEGEPLPDATQYFAMEVRGRAEPDFGAMHLKRKHCCPQCGQFSWNRQRLEPLILDRDFWDGSDICRIESVPGYCICSERFQKLVEENGLTGFSFWELDVR